VGSAQARYAAGTRAILECYLDGRPIRAAYLIVKGGRSAGGWGVAKAGRDIGEQGNRGQARRPRLRLEATRVFVFGRNHR
jgi:formate dehydrogenase